MKKANEDLRSDEDLRLAALETLLEAEKSGVMATVLIKQKLEGFRDLPRNRRSFFNRLTKGTLEQQIRLDHIISAYSAKPASKLKNTVRWILRLSLYQLCEMKRIPPSAVVNEAVKLTRKKGYGALGGFVNAVLRNYIRDPGKAAQPEKDEPVKYISLTYSMPEYLVKKWIEEYGFEMTETICASFLKERPVVVRIRQSGPGREKPLHFELMEPEGAAALSGFDTFDSIPAFREGRIYVQDTGSQIAVMALEPESGMKILDMCAAPGGKSMTAADIAGESAFVTARDLSPEKTALIEENIKRCRFGNITVQVRDASVFYEEDEEQYDAVIADLPCSGYGVIGRKPEIKYTASPEKEDELIKIQRSILENAVRYVKPGGRLMYSTCTLNRRENEDNADWLKERFGLRMEKCFTLLPGTYPGDGFFVSVFTRLRSDRESPDDRRRAAG